MKSFAIFTLAAVLALAVAMTAQTSADIQSATPQDQMQQDQEQNSQVAAPAPAAIPDAGAPAVEVGVEHHAVQTSASDEEMNLDRSSKKFKDSSNPDAETLLRIFPDEFYY